MHSFAFVRKRVFAYTFEYITYYENHVLYEAIMKNYCAFDIPTIVPLESDLESTPPFSTRCDVV